MKEQVLIGVDIGTTSIKAVAFTPSGQAVKKVAVPTPTHYPQANWAHYEPGEVWDAISSGLRDLMNGLPEQCEPAGVAFASMAEAAVPVTKKGEACYPAIAWFDNRTQAQADWWRKEIGEGQTAEITGLPVNPIFGALKLSWLKQNEPAIFTHIDAWLNMADYAVFKLTGVQATDYSLASRTLLFDIKQKAWSERLLSAAGLPIDIFAEAVPSGLKVGEVNARASKETGLPEGLPVVSGGHDHVCAALALSIVESGTIFDSIGTAESLFMSVDEPRLGPAITSRGIAHGVHVAPDRYYAMSGLGYSGGTIDWARQTVLSTFTSSEEAFNKLIRLAEAIPAGSEGVYFLPQLRQANPPQLNPSAKAAFLGLRSHHTAGHLLRAVIEGVAYAYQYALDNMLDAFALEPKRIVATGGGTQNALLITIKNDLFGQPLFIADNIEATCLGAAMLAGIGAGVYESFQDAGDRVTMHLHERMPTMDMHHFYRERFERVHLNLYGALADVHKLIDDQS